MAKLVSGTYGEALFELAQEKNTVSAMLEEVSGLQMVLKENKELSVLMNNPKVSKEEREGIVKEVFGGRICDDLLNFLILLVQKGRYAYVEEILAYFTDRVKEAEGIGTAYVTTAVELTPAKKDEVHKKLLATTSYREIEIIYQVDPSLIGGMTVRINDRVIDSSIKTKLEKMERSLLTIQLAE
ncbi:MAG: F0F1 ATP synthase subunit delta [Lachnospiraceae bacterium]|nr:F0F1 ATP synthase subunit delta [Lachnospiraceae bacterium]